MQLTYNQQQYKISGNALEVNGVENNFCDNVKYLRVLFDSKSRFENHVNNVVSKENQRSLPSELLIIRVQSL